MVVFMVPLTQWQKKCGKVWFFFWRVGMMPGMTMHISKFIFSWETGKLHRNCVRKNHRGYKGRKNFGIGLIDRHERTTNEGIYSSIRRRCAPIHTYTPSSSHNAIQHTHTICIASFTFICPKQVPVPIFTSFVSFQWRHNIRTHRREDQRSIDRSITASMHANHAMLVVRPLESIPSISCLMVDCVAGTASFIASLPAPSYLSFFTTVFFAPQANYYFYSCV